MAVPDTGAAIREISSTGSAAGTRRVGAGRWRGLGEAALIEAAGESLLGDPEAWLALPGAQLLKRSRNTLARVPWPGGAGAPMMLKIFPVRGAIGALQSGWRPSKARKGWAKARALIERGFATPRPRLALERRNALGLLAASALWVDWVAGRPVRELLKPWRRRPRDPSQTEACHAFLGELARCLRRLHDAGVVHRDFGGGNVLMGPEGQFTLVDINRARIGAGPVSWRGRLRDLERVHLQADDRPVFFGAYCLDNRERERWEEAYLRRAAAYRGRGR
jgi:hypothetical protein